MSAPLIGGVFVGRPDSTPSSSSVTNASSVPGATVTDALNYLYRVQIAADVVALSYDFALADAGRLIPGNNGSLQTFTLLNQATRGWTQGDTILVLQKGAGQVAIAAGGGVTLRNPSIYQARTLSQWAVISLIYQGSDVWVLGGDRALV